jgi:hypothetical protein
MKSLSVRTEEITKRWKDREVLPLPKPMPLGPCPSPGRRWRFRRDLVIFVAAREGFSQRVLAEVFDLPRSRVAAIIKAVKEKHGKDPVGAAMLHADENPNRSCPP